MTEYNFRSHPLLSLVLENARPTLEGLSAHITEHAHDADFNLVMPDPDDPLTLKQASRSGKGRTEAESYHLQVLDQLNDSLSIRDQLDQIAVYLSGFPNARQYEEQGITQDKWIHYHYTNYLIDTVGLYDISLLMVNTVFQLGISPKSCNKDTVARHDHVKDTPVKPALDELEQLLKPHKDYRHFFVHRGQIPKLQGLDMLEMFSLSQHFGQPVIPVEIIDELYQAKCGEIVEALKAEIAQIDNVLCKLYDALIPPYKNLTDRYATGS